MPFTGLSSINNAISKFCHSSKTCVTCMSWATDSKANGRVKLKLASLPVFQNRLSFSLFHSRLTIKSFIYETHKNTFPLSIKHTLAFIWALRFGVLVQDLIAWEHFQISPLLYSVPKKFHMLHVLASAECVSVLHPTAWIQYLSTHSLIRLCSPTSTHLINVVLTVEQRSEISINRSPSLSWQRATVKACTGSRT